MQKEFRKKYSKHFYNKDLLSTGEVLLFALYTLFGATGIGAITLFIMLSIGALKIF